MQPEINFEDPELVYMKSFKTVSREILGNNQSRS